VHSEAQLADVWSGEALLFKVASSKLDGLGTFSSGACLCCTPQQRAWAPLWG